MEEVCRMKNKLSNIKKEDFNNIQSLTFGSFDGGRKFAIVANLRDGTRIEIAKGNIE